MRIRIYSVLLSVLLFSLLVAGASAVSVSISPTQMEEGDTVTIRISNLADGRVFSLRMESAIELHGSSEFTYQANAVTIPFGLNTPRVSLVASPVTRAGIEASEGETTKGMAKLGSGTITISETLSSIPSSTIKYIKATGIPEAGSDAVDIMLELSGTKTGPDSGEITFGIEGISDGSARIIVLVDGTEVRNQLVTIGSPKVGLPVASGLKHDPDRGMFTITSLDGKAFLSAASSSILDADPENIRLIQAEAANLQKDWIVLSGPYIVTPASTVFSPPAELAFLLDETRGAPFIASYSAGTWTILPSRITGSYLSIDVSQSGQYAMMVYREDDSIKMNATAPQSAGGWAALIGVALIGVLLVIWRRRG